MLVPQVQQLHENDRLDHAKRLGLSLSEFDRLVASANQAYEIIKELGPFYGREDNKEPTFRITAEPVTLPKGSKATLTQLGNDLVHLAHALKSLPEKSKQDLGGDFDFNIPPTWRIDVIIDEMNQLRVNEIEGQDGAHALMMAEQLAYNLQTLKESTAARLIPAIKSMSIPQKNGNYKIALIRVDNPHNSNAERFIKFIDILSKGTLQMPHFNENHIINGEVTIDWDEYAGVMTETSFHPHEFLKLGLKKEQLLSTGIYNAMVNKGVFALVFEQDLAKFWTEQLGTERFERLKKILIPTSFIRSAADLKKARTEGKVVKVSWAGANAYLVNRSKGVAMPMNETEHGNEERWGTIEDLLEKGIKIIAQDLVIPARIPAFLRKKGITLEPVEWYNRVCVKYVVAGNPNSEPLPEMELAATEVTLGPDVIPAGRKCAFTAGKLLSLALLFTSDLLNLGTRVVI